MRISASITFASFASFVALLIPVCTAIWFVWLYATPMPLTDEWLFLRGVIRGEFVPKIYDHMVVVPYAIYWVVAQASNFDSRALVLVTLICFGVQAWLFGRFIIGSAIGTVPVVVILFSPAHFMEMQWGFQFTLALSATLPIAGLVIAAQVREGDPWWRQFALIVGAFTVITLGALSSAGGVFGFPACAVLFWLRPADLRTRIGASVLAILMTSAFFLTFTSAGGATFGLSKVGQWLTMPGALIWGMPVVFMNFDVDRYTLTGLSMIVCGATAIALAWRSGTLPDMALPAAILVFSVLVCAATVGARAYLGNWHLQYAIPGVCAIYAMCYLLAQRQGQFVLCGAMLCIMSLSVFGYVAAFTTHGPNYLNYIRSIEDYARRVTAEPDLTKPFPMTGGWDFDAEMAAFLRARGHASLVEPGQDPR